jgi:hypothetical protein
MSGYWLKNSATVASTLKSNVHMDTGYDKEVPTVKRNWTL